MKTATFTWTVNVDVREDFDQNNPDHVKIARREAWLNVHESNGELTDTDGDEEDGEVCPECGSPLVPAMIEGTGKTLAEIKKCSSDNCDYNLC